MVGPLGLPASRATRCYERRRVFEVAGLGETLIEGLHAGIGVRIGGTCRAGPLDIRDRFCLGFLCLGLRLSVANAVAKQELHAVIPQ